MNQARESYTPGYTPNALDFMSRRTAESHAAFFFLPHLKAACGCSIAAAGRAKSRLGWLNASALAR